MTFRSWLALALLVFAVAAERCGYYALRSFLMIHLTRAGGMSMHDAANVYRTFTIIAYLAPFAGGGLALLIGPRLTAVIGAIVAAVGAFALATGAPPAVAAMVVALGTGTFKPCPYAAGAEILADEDGGSAQGFAPSARRFASVATFMVVAYAAINLGAFVAPPTTGLLAETRGVGATFGVAGALDVLAALVAGGAFFLGSRRAADLARDAHAPYRAPQGEPQPAPFPAPRSRDDLAVFGPLVLIGVAFVLMHIGLDQGTPPYGELRDARCLMSINPIVVLVLAVPSFALYLVLATQRSPLPLTKVLGPGLLVFSLGIAITTYAHAAHVSTGTWAFGLVVMSAGEAIAAPIGLTYAALALRAPRATMVVAGWLSLTVLPGYMLGFGGYEARSNVPPLLFGGLSVVTTLGFGLYLLVAGDRVHRQLGGHSNATS